MLLAHNLGNSVVVQRRFDPEDWLRLLAKYRVTTTFSAPTPIRMVCNLPPERKAPYDRSSMRRMIANAAPWSHALKELYLADFPEDSLFEVYGSTELDASVLQIPMVGFLPAGDPLFDPDAYHGGTVWPLFSMFILEGL